MPVRAEGFDEDVLDGLAVLVAGIELAATLDLAEMDPVRRAVASALEAGGFAERFQQDGADAVAPQPVGGQLAGDAGEQVGGQPRDADPGQDGHTLPTLGTRRSPCITSSIRWPDSG